MIQIIVLLIVLGVALYLVETYIPMSPPIQTVLRVIVVLFVILLILSMFGIISAPSLNMR